MADPKNPPEDERIEELLSQLQGIFGKLSQSEEEEAKEKIDLPSATTPTTPAAEQTPAAPPIAPSPLAPEPAPEASIAPLTASADSQAAPWYAVPTPQAAEERTTAESQPLPEEVIAMPAAAAPIAEPTPAQSPAEDLLVPAVSPPAEAAPIMQAPLVHEETSLTPPTPAPLSEQPKVSDTFPAAEAPLDPSHTPTGIFYPSDREAESKILTERLQALTPKFTKVTFQLKVVWTVAYDRRVEWKDALLAAVNQHPVQTLFLVVDRPLDDARRKTLTAALEPLGIYFQDVPLLSVEKKAFYTDLLLGLVFFFDSRKPKDLN